MIPQLSPYPAPNAVTLESFAAYAQGEPLIAALFALLIIGAIVFVILDRVEKQNA